MSILDAAWIVGEWSWALSLALLARCYSWRPRLPWFVTWIAVGGVRGPLILWLSDHASTRALADSLRATTAPVAIGLFAAAFTECAVERGRARLPLYVGLAACGASMLPSWFARAGFNHIPAQVVLLCAALFVLSFRRPLSLHQRIMACYCVVKAVAPVSVLFGSMGDAGAFEWEVFGLTAILAWWVCAVAPIARRSRLIG